MPVKSKTLWQLCHNHKLRLIDGFPGGTRWVIASADKSTPEMFGELHMAEDYSMCGALQRERGMVFMFQRNGKPVKEVE